MTLMTDSEYLPRVQVGWKAHQAKGGTNEYEERKELQHFNELPAKIQVTGLQVRPAEDMYNSSVRALKIIIIIKI